MKTGKKKSSDENVEWSKEGEISIFLGGGGGWEDGREQEAHREQNG